MNVHAIGGNLMKAMYQLGIYLSKSSVEQRILHLIYYRVSQINGCAFCLDMHSKDLLTMGETAQRLLLLDAWREVPFYTDRERAAFAWVEAVTTLPNKQVPDQVYQQAREQFSEEELLDLTAATIAINGYNRLNIAFQVPGGSYVPGQFAAKTA